MTAAMHGQLAREFAQMALQLQRCREVKEIVEVVLDLALAGVNCRHVGLMLWQETAQLESVGVTDAVAEEADRLQLELGGPCLAFVAGAATVRIDDTIADQRWPRWSSRIAGLGLRSVLSTHLERVGSTIGALTLYDESPERFTAESAAMAEIVARHAARALTDCAGGPADLSAGVGRSGCGRAGRGSSGAGLRSLSVAR